MKCIMLLLMLLMLSSCKSPNLQQTGYLVKPGDTYRSISIFVYNTPDYEDELRYISDQETGNPEVGIVLPLLELNK